MELERIRIIEKTHTSLQSFHCFQTGINIRQLSQHCIFFHQRKTMRTVTGIFRMHVIKMFIFQRRNILLKIQTLKRYSNKSHIKGQATIC